MVAASGGVRISLTTSIYCLVRNAAIPRRFRSQSMTEQFHLVVATPCFGGQVSSIYASSIFHLQRALRSKSNVDLKIHLRDGDALITRARANLVTLFLDDPAATHLLFLDADIGFRPEQVFRLIESGADVVAGVYPIKRVNWDKARRALEANRSNVA